MPKGDRMDLKKMVVQTEDNQDIANPADMDDSQLNEAILQAEEEQGVQSEVEDKGAEIEKNKEIPKTEISQSQKEEKEKQVEGKEETELEILKRTNKEKESFIQKQAAEIGESRKREKERLESQSSKVDDLKDLHDQEVIEEITGAVKADIDRDNSLARLDENDLGLQIEQTKNIAMKAVPEIESLLNDIATLAAADGFSEDKIKEFKVEPYLSDPNILISYARIAQTNKKNTELMKENELLKHKDQTTLELIKNASESTTGLTSNVVSSDRSSSVNYNESNIHNMSDAALEEALLKAN